MHMLVMTGMSPVAQVTSECREPSLLYLEKVVLVIDHAMEGAIKHPICGDAAIKDGGEFWHDRQLCRLVHGGKGLWSEERQVHTGEVIVTEAQL